MKNKLLLVNFLALPFLFSCNGNAKTLDEINKILTEHKDEINTCYDAISLEGVKEKIEASSLKDKQEYVYDSKAKQFVIMNQDIIDISSSGYTPSENKIDYFKFVKSYNPNSKYSQYLLEDAEGVDNLIVTTGLDVGTHKDIRNVTYSNKSGTSKNIILRTYCDYLKIDSPLDTINHFNTATNIIITDIATFNTYGETAYMKTSGGTINFDPAGQTDLFEITSGSTVKVESTKESKVYGLVNCKKGDDGCKAQTCYKLTEKVVKNAAGFKDAITAKDSKDGNFIRLGSDIIFEKSSANEGELESMVVGHSLCIDLNGFKLSLSDFKQSDKSQINEAIRIESDSTGDKSVYIIDSQGVVDEYSGISLNDCSIVVAGYYEEKEETTITSNLVLNSGMVKQTISNTAESNSIGGAITLLGKTLSSHNRKEAYLKMYGGKISCVNNSSNNNFGCVAAVGEGSNIEIVYGSLSSDEYCLYGSTSSGYDLGKANVNITAGELISANDNTCVYFPLTSTISVETSIIKGGTGFNVTSGSLDISKTILTAEGTGAEVAEKNYDGSAIYIPKDRNDSGELIVNINSSIVTSKYSYIINVTGNDSVKNNTTINLSYTDFTYYSGDGCNVFSNEKVTINKSDDCSWTKREK